MARVQPHHGEVVLDLLAHRGDELLLPGPAAAVPPAAARAAVVLRHAAA